MLQIGSCRNHVCRRVKGKTRKRDAMAEKKVNKTAFPDGARPQLLKLEANKFKCPFCRKVGGYPELTAHLQGHWKVQVKYGGYSIYRCNLGCETVGHYHCRLCPRMFEKKHRFLKHLKRGCKTVTGAPSAAAVSTTMAPATAVVKLAPAVLTVVAPVTITPMVPEERRANQAQVAVATPAPLAAQLPQALVAAPGTEVSQEASGVQEALEPVGADDQIPIKSPETCLPRRNTTNCRFCNIEIRKKNLPTHIRRRHSPKTTDLTADCRLPSVCAVKKSEETVNKKKKKLKRLTGRVDDIAVWCKYMESRARKIPLTSLPHFQLEVETLIFKYSVEQNMASDTTMEEFTSM